MPESRKVQSLISPLNYHLWTGIHRSRCHNTILRDTSRISDICEQIFVILSNLRLSVNKDNNPTCILHVNGHQQHVGCPQRGLRVINCVPNVQVMLLAKLQHNIRAGFGFFLYIYASNYTRKYISFDILSIILLTKKRNEKSIIQWRAGIKNGEMLH